jgi:hypothetical protein
VSAKSESVTVTAPRTPGADPVVVWRGESAAAAEAWAQVAFGGRRDLRYQDVVVRVGAKRVAFAGPAR